MTEGPIKVLIVEDHEVVAEGLAALLSAQSDIEVVGKAHSVADARLRAKEVAPDIALLDFRLPDGTGADAARGIRASRPHTKLIFLSREDGDAARLAAVEAGASGFIHKSRAAAEVVSAIRQVAGGQSLITPASIATVLQRGRAAEEQAESLTARERAVLAQMAIGVDSHEIATRLGISYATVRTHIRSIAAKLGVHSKLQIVARATELGLIER